MSVGAMSRTNKPEDLMDASRNKVTPPIKEKRIQSEPLQTLRSLGITTALQLTKVTVRHCLGRAGGCRYFEGRCVRLT